MPHAKQVVQELQVRGMKFLVTACIESKYVIRKRFSGCKENYLSYP